MILKNFFCRKHYSLGIQLLENGLMLLELCQHKGQCVEGKFYRLSDDSSCSNKPKTKIAHASISDLKIMYKTISMSRELTRDDVLLELQMNQSNYFPHITDDLLFEVALPEIKSTKQKVQEIIIFAMRKSDVEANIHQACRHHLSLISLEPESYSLLRIISFCRKTFDPEKLYAAFFCFNEQYRLILFSNGFVREEQKQAINNSSWCISDLAFVGRALQDSISTSVQIDLGGCFLVSSAEMPSDFIKALSEIVACEIELINPFHHIQCDMPDDVEKSDAMIALGSALRGLNV